MNIFEKLLWLDLETTGLDKEVNGIIQMAGIIEVKGVVKKEFDIRSNVFSDTVIDDDALKITGTTREQIKSYKEPRLAFRELTDVLGRYVQKFQSHDKLLFAGYNISGFDKDFIWAWSKKCEEKYFGSYVRGYCIEVSQTVLHADMLFDDFNPLNHKLATVAEYMGIEINAHDAMSDIRASREIFIRLMKRILRGGL